MSPNLHLFNNLHSFKGIKVILQLIIIDYYSAIFKAISICSQMKLCFLYAGIKITSSFLHYLKNQIGIVIHLQMWRPKKHTDIFSTLSQISTPAWDKKVRLSRFFIFPVGFGFYSPWLLRSWKSLSFLTRIVVFSIWQIFIYLQSVSSGGKADMTFLINFLCYQRHV